MTTLHDKQINEFMGRVEARNPGGATAQPDLDDGVMYLDDAVAAIVARYGTADDGGVRYYAVGNEPDLWRHTHPRVRAENPTPQELGRRVLDAARAIKAVDPSAQVIGPTPALVIGQKHLGRPGAFAELAERGYDHWLQWLLDEARQAEEVEGQRLLDVLSINWYVDGEVAEHAGMLGVLQSPRTLWDPTWHDPSWRGECFPSLFPVLPKLQRDIAERYPGTQLAITEFNPQAKDTIFGSIALADMLGVFGREGLSIATYWSLLPFDSDDPVPAHPAVAAYRLFREADGRGLGFGDVSLPITGNDRPHLVSAYAARDTQTGNLHLVLLSKYRHRPVPVTLDVTGLNIDDVQAFGYGRDRGFDVAPVDGVNVEDHRLALTLPPLSAIHVVIEPADGVAQRSP